MKRKILGMFLIALMLAVVFTAVPMNVSADGPEGLKIRPVTISGSDETLVDFQVEILVSYDSDMRTDFGDIRFTDDQDNTIPHFLASYVDGTSAVFYVKVPSIPMTGITIFMTYGDSELTDASDGDATFEFFDDFDDGVWTDKWTVVYAGGISETGGILTLGPNNYKLSSNYVFDGRPFIMEDRKQRINNYEVFSGLESQSPALYHNVRTADSSYWSNSGFRLENGGNGGTTVSSGIINGNLLVYQLMVDGISASAMRGTSLQTLGEPLVKSLNQNFNMHDYRIVLNCGSTSNIGKYDWIRIRKYADPMPMASVGEEVLFAREIKQGVISDLESAKMNVESIDTKLDNAIGHIQNSLEETRWVDDTHLDSKKGKKVFDEEKKAIKDLKKLMDKDNTPQSIKDACQSAIDKLISADEMLAAIALEEALDMDVQNLEDQVKYDKEIYKVEEEILKAEKQLTDGKPDKAIDHYKMAWEHAQKAIKHAT